MAIFILLLAVYIRWGQPPALPKKQTFLPAFPGAEGFGTSTPGGRFGRIVFVTNLNDTTDVSSPAYAGSLRWAVEHAWPDDPADPYGQRRIIIFKVGGEIPLVDSLILKHPFITIAGQTAPGDGITLRGNELIVATHDVIVRGIRIRVGDQGEPTCCLDGISISTYHSDSDVYNIVVDHSSISWAIDENFSFWIDPSKPYLIHDVTLQWLVISEGLHNSIHIDEGATVPDPHSMGLIIGAGVSNASIHHNLFAHNWGRNPRLSGVSNTEIINNLIYDWGDKGLEINSGVNVARIKSNYFKPGDSSNGPGIYLGEAKPGSALLFDGNLLEQSGWAAGFNSIGGQKLTTAQKPKFEPSNILITKARAAYNHVLQFAGAIAPFRDSIDVRLVSDVKAGAGLIIDSQSQVGGWTESLATPAYLEDRDEDGIPSEWESSHGLDPNIPDDANDPARLSPAGYSWIEEYINSLLPVTN
ncbi:MAG: right-handed parallel beta-helix repeat-containing protein [Chloroflexi bacterium]|nr:right-handed parallel beta-helix repeat-containing protein [Chloroflexota bacterium]